MKLNVLLYSLALSPLISCAVTPRFHIECTVALLRNLNANDKGNLPSETPLPLQLHEEPEIQEGTLVKRHLSPAEKVPAHLLVVFFQ